MLLTCPECHSSNIKAKNRAKKAGSAIGTVAGTAAGATGILSGTELGATAGLFAGPAGVVVGGIADAVLGALFGGAIGCKLAGNLGEVIDKNILDNYCCMSCDHNFTVPSFESHDFEERPLHPFPSTKPMHGFSHPPNDLDDAY